MTNQLNLNYRNANANLNKLWLYSSIFLSALVLITLCSSVAILPAAFYLSNMVLCLLFIIVVVVLKFKKKQVTLVKIEENQLQYFCPIKKETVMIPTNEITKVTTQFCELQIHTYNRTHCLNLKKIKQEQQRWEIKEMIKKFAAENEQRASEF